MTIFRNLLRGLRVLGNKERQSLEMDEELRGFMEASRSVSEIDSLCD